MREDTPAAAPTCTLREEGGFESLCIHREHFLNIDSTQTYLTEKRLPELQRALSGSLHRPTIYIASADHQDVGRGKGSRSWFSSKEHINFAMSLLFEIPARMVAKAPLFTQLLALIATKSLESSLPGSMAQIKWPNDLIIRGRKVGGILAELHLMGSDSYSIIIGIGINLDIPDEVLNEGVSGTGRWPPGAIKQILGVEIDASKLRHDISSYFIREIVSFITNNGVSGALVDEISRRQIFVGSNIHFSEGGPEPIIGIHRGVDASTGGIVIELPGGNTRVFHSGEIIYRLD